MADTRTPHDVPLWLSAAVYRTIADPEIEMVNHRNAIAEVFNDFPRALIDEIVDSLIEYGIVTETGETDRLHGDLRMVSYPED
jgi:hypothetical protein